MFEPSYSGRGRYPPGLRPGDFIQTTDHFGDVFFEVDSCMPPRDGGEFWMISYVTYEKYGSEPRIRLVNSAGSIRKVYQQEMAVPVMMFRRQRLSASFGQYDPIFGYAPAGTPLRTRN